jgi:hypothetical protein
VGLVNRYQWVPDKQLGLSSNTEHRLTDYDFSMPIPIIGRPKKPIPINRAIFKMYL